MIDTVIFDLDGTLLDTLDDLTDSVNYAMNKFGFPCHTRDEVRLMVGNSVIYLIETAVPQGTDKQVIEECISAFEQHYAGNMRNKTAPYEGIMQMLEQVKAGGYKAAVVSNKPDGFTKQLVRELFGEYVSLAIGRSDSFPRKPAPDMVLHALDLLESSTKTAVYVGDSEVDALTAANAGMPCVGCLWGFRDRQTLEESGITCFASSPDELIGIFERT